MVDTTTTVLAFVKQTIGANRNTWGNILNTNFDMVEEAICGRQATATTGGSTTLTQAQARKRYQDISGALLSDATIVVPNASKGWIFTNACTGDFAVLVKTSGGTATSVPAGTSKEINCDGANACVRADINEVGQMAFFGAVAVPSGWFECDGTTKSRAGRGIDLFGKASTTWGAGNGVTTFGLPDAYTAGKFLRARTASVALGTAQSDQNLAHGHAGSTATVALSMAGTASADGAHTPTGSVTADTPDHSHVVTLHADTLFYSAGGQTAQIFNSGSGTSFSTGGASVTHLHTVVMNAVATHTHAVDFTGSSATSTVTVASNGGTEARPTNLSAILAIKY